MKTNDNKFCLLFSRYLPKSSSRADISPALGSLDITDLCRKTFFNGVQQVSLTLWPSSIQLAKADRFCLQQDNNTDSPSQLFSIARKLKYDLNSSFMPM